MQGDFEAGGGGGAGAPLHLGGGGGKDTAVSDVNSLLAGAHLQVGEHGGITTYNLCVKTGF